jgi:hypothetical protein
MRSQFFQDEMSSTESQLMNRLETVLNWLETNLNYD